MPKRELTFKVELHDEKRDDSYLREHNAAKAAIDRMDAVLKEIQHLITTPLMEETGKSPMLRPPITKTNVLKMDNNFKGAVALYDFIIAYDKPGYACEDKNVTLAPFSEVLSDELSEAGALLSFLTYEYGLGLNEKLKNNFALAVPTILDAKDLNYFESILNKLPSKSICAARTSSIEETGLPLRPLAG